MILLLAFLALCCAFSKAKWADCDVRKNEVKVSHAGQRYIAFIESDDVPAKLRTYCLFGPGVEDGFELCRECTIYGRDDAHGFRFFVVVFGLVLLCIAVIRS